MIRLVQCLCERRHAILAVAYNPEELDSDTAILGFKEEVRVLVERRVIRDVCGLCGSKNWFYEDGATKFRTLEEAAPELRAFEFEQSRLRRCTGIRRS